MLEDVANCVTANIVDLNPVLIRGDVSISVTYIGRVAPASSTFISGLNSHGLVKSTGS